MTRNNHPIREEQTAAGIRKSIYPSLEHRMMDFSILFEVSRFEFWRDFRCNGMIGNIWVSACLVRDLKPARWEFVGENRLDDRAVRNRTFYPCLSIVYWYAQVNFEQTLQITKIRRFQPQWAKTKNNYRIQGQIRSQNKSRLV